MEEIRDICFGLHIDYDGLNGETKAAKSRELLRYLERRNNIQALVAWLQRYRSDIQIPERFQPSPAAHAEAAPQARSIDNTANTSKKSSSGSSASIFLYLSIAAVFGFALFLVGQLLLSYIKPPATELPTNTSLATSSTAKGPISTLSVTPLLEEDSTPALPVTPWVAKEPTSTPHNITPMAPHPSIIKIAVQAPLTGLWSEMGIGVRNAAGLSITQQNRPLTDLGYQLEMIEFDDKADPELGRETARESVLDPDVLCVVGHFNAAVTLSAYEYAYRSAGITVISPSNTNPAVTDSTENIWRLVGRDDVQAIIAAEYAKEALRSQRAYIVHDDTPYSRAAASLFQESFISRGGSIVAFRAYDRNSIDFSPIISDIRNENPDLVYFTGSGVLAGDFFKLSRDSGVSALFLGPDTLDNEQVLKLAGSAAIGLHFTTVSAPISQFPQATKFASDYRAKYNTYPSSFTPESYDATTLCIKAIAKAARTAGKKPTRTQVTEAMKSIGTFSGISGDYTFNTNGDPESVGFYIVEVKSNNWRDNRIIDKRYVRTPEQ